MSKTGTPGTLSHGTMRLEDLIPTFIDKLDELGAILSFTVHEWRLLNKVLDNPGHSLYFETEDYDALDEIVNSLFDQLDSFSPPNHYFGASVGDGSDYGWFPDDQWY